MQEDCFHIRAELHIHQCQPAPDKRTNKTGCCFLKKRIIILYKLIFQTLRLYPRIGSQVTILISSKHCTLLYTVYQTPKWPLIPQPKTTVANSAQLCRQQWQRRIGWSWGSTFIHCPLTWVSYKCEGQKANELCRNGCLHRFLHQDTMIKQI